MLVAGCLPGLASAQLQVVPEHETQCVFAGTPRNIEVIWRNDGDKPIAVPVHLQVYQASSATVMEVGSSLDWKQLDLLPHQTVVETVSLTFPPVKTGTRFLIRWLDEISKVLGHSDLIVYPTNLLDALEPLTERKPVGVFDPQNQLKPLLKAAALEFEDLEFTGLKRFSGKLAILGPFPAKTSEPQALARNIAELANSGVAVVWIKPPPAIGPELEPAVYSVRLGHGAVSVVQAHVVTNLADSPLAQLNLIRSAELAVKPDLLSLYNPQP
ncbi:MAG: hypothetical protein JWQ04_1514 [Pedosphaera sp.]|nr:hypothetical protein [Pedosphaera sp.]